MISLSRRSVGHVCVVHGCQPRKSCDRLTFACLLLAVFGFAVTVAASGATAIPVRNIKVQQGEMAHNVKAEGERECEI